MDESPATTASRRRVSQVAASALVSFPVSLRGTCPAGKNLQLHVVIIRADGPVGRALYYGIAERFEVCDRNGPRRWPECGPEALVGALVCVDCGDN